MFLPIKCEPFSKNIFILQERVIIQIPSDKPIETQPYEPTFPEHFRSRRRILTVSTLEPSYQSALELYLTDNEKKLYLDQSFDQVEPKIAQSSSEPQLYSPSGQQSQSDIEKEEIMHRFKKELITPCTQGQRQSPPQYQEVVEYRPPPPYQSTLSSHELSADQKQKQLPPYPLRDEGPIIKQVFIEHVVKFFKKCSRKLYSEWTILNEFFSKLKFTFFWRIYAFFLKKNLFTFQEKSQPVTPQKKTLNTLDESNLQQISVTKRPPPPPPPPPQTYLNRKKPADEPLNEIDDSPASPFLELSRSMKLSVKEILIELAETPNYQPGKWIMETSLPQRARQLLDKLNISYSIREPSEIKETVQTKKV